ncbi:MAG: transposase [Oribacterium sp.]|nr:transposase [Oribacterium sp.]
MSFVPNYSQQISLFDKLAFLSKRKEQMLQNSWAQAFSDHIFTRINEHIFSPLYSERSNSRPNAPVNVVVGALILKSFSDLTDEEITEACEFDFRYQYALHTTSFEEQPVSVRSLSRFRSRLAAYELTTGEDLLHKCFCEMAESMCRYMEISPSIKRMDSMMIESNIRKMGRVELLYTCLSNLVKEIHRDGKPELLEGLEHYANDNDRNAVIYHDQKTPQAEKLQKIIDDASSLLPKCAKEYADTEDYELLERAILEQTKKDDDGHNIPKEKGDGMDARSLQNPADPDATYRAKAGTQHRGYAANITEAVDENGSLVTDYQYDCNTRSDISFLQEVIEKADAAEEVTGIIADGAYASKELAQEAAKKNIAIVTTGLRGPAPRDILLEFVFSEDRRNVLTCPEGHTPKRSTYTSYNHSLRTSFPRECCENCQHREECNAKIKARTALVNISLGALEHAEEVSWRKDDESIKLIGRIRNGVETIPSVLRRKYRVDRMPVRGKLKTKVFFGFKLCALNFSKLWSYERGILKCRPLQVETA